MRKAVPLDALYRHHMYASNLRGPADTGELGERGNSLVEVHANVIGTSGIASCEIVTNGLDAGNGASGERDGQAHGRRSTRSISSSLAQGREARDEVIASPAGALRPRHEVVQALGIRPETAKAFSAGYCAERARFVIPIFDEREADPRSVSGENSFG